MERFLDPAVLMKAVLYVIVLVLSIAVHEFGHAFVADRLGDRVARAQGRVTLNPLAHIDPFGTLLFPFIGATTGLPVLGWGKPVFHNLHARFVPRHIRLRTARLLVSAAGPLMNIALAMTLSIVYVVLIRAERLQLLPLCDFVLRMNISLAFFNLIPCPPLDGRSILFWFLPDRHPVVQFLEQYGVWIFFLMLLTGTFSVVMAPVFKLSSLWVGQLQLLAR